MGDLNTGSDHIQTGNEIVPVATLNADIQPISDGARAAIESATSVDSMLDPDFLIRIFDNPDNASERQMRSAIERLCDFMTQDPKNIAKWAEALRRARIFDSRKDSFAHASSDDFHLEALTGNSHYVSRWVSSSTRSLDELLNHPGSTFMHLGNAQAVSYAFSSPNFNSLSDVARHLRSAMHAKLFQTAAREIFAERERRLGAAFGVRAEVVIPAMRWQYPSYDVMDLGRLKRYMAGDRGEDIMGIGDWIDLDHRAARECPPLHRRDNQLKDVQKPVLTHEKE